MTDPAIEAMNRAINQDCLDPVSTARGAREALAPIRTKVELLEEEANNEWAAGSLYGLGMRHVLAALKPDIYTTEELNQARRGRARPPA